MSAYNYKPKTCGVCDSEFRPTGGIQKYCSPACAREGGKVTRSCKECGQTFERFGYDLNTYCSKSCANKATAGRRAESLRQHTQLMACEECGEPFKKQKMGQRWCSRKCASKARRQPLRIRERSIPGWSLKAKDESACRNCGRPATHLHHIVPRSKSKLARADVQRNGMPLCFACHRGWHDHTVEIYRDRLTAEELVFAIETGGEVWVEGHYPYRPDQQLRRLYAVSIGESPDDEWRFCREAEDGAEAVDRAGAEASTRLVEAQHAEWEAARS